MKGVPYHELVGGLLWASLIAHPEITFAVSYLSCFNANPGRSHWEAAKRVLRYLKGCLNAHFILGGNPNYTLDLLAYTDASWAEDRDDRRSTSGYIVKMGDSTISWSSKKQTTVATSSCEAEYMAASYSARQVVWLRSLLSELGADLTNSPTL